MSVMKSKIIVLLSFASFLLIGIAIPKLSLRDSVVLTDEEKNCVQINIQQQFDNPFQRIALALGKSVVTEKQKNTMVMKSYTFFRIPLPATRLFNRYTQQVVCDWASEKITRSNDALFLEIPASIIPDGWYAHRVHDEAILLTRQKELPKVEGTEMYAYGEQIGISVVRPWVTDTTPEELAASKTLIDVDDVLVRKAEWDTINGYKLLRVEHETPADPQLSEYLFVENAVYIFSLYPILDKNMAVFEEMISEFVRTVLER